MARTQVDFRNTKSASSSRLFQRLHKPLRTYTGSIATSAESGFHLGFCRRLNYVYPPPPPRTAHKKLTALLLPPLLLGGCIQHTTPIQHSSPITPIVASATTAPQNFVATGYGSQNAFGKYSVGQRKLMAMRAAKVDAYRNLAELVYGFSVDGRTTVADFVAQNDQARSWVSAFIRGARVTEVVQESDGNYRATVELPSSVRLVECLVHSHCTAPVSVVPNCTGTHCGVYTAPVVTHPCVTGCVAPAFHYAN